MNNSDAMFDTLAAFNVPSLDALSLHSDVPAATLRNWYTQRPVVFNALCLHYMCATHTEPEPETDAA